MSYTFEDFILHPFSVLENILSNSLNSAPESSIPTNSREHRFAIGKPRRYLQHGSLQKDCYRIEIARKGREAQTKRLKRNRSTSSKGVKYFG
jgi:hypothetical protein